MSPIKTDAYSLDSLRLLAKNLVKLRAQAPSREVSKRALGIPTRIVYIASSTRPLKYLFVSGTTPYRRGREERLYAERHKLLI
jgi:hypothetical protein